jgi:hypothetical protein
MVFSNARRRRTVEPMGATTPSGSLSPSPRTTFVRRVCLVVIAVRSSWCQRRMRLNFRVVSVNAASVGNRSMLEAP